MAIFTADDLKPRIPIEAAVTEYDDLIDEILEEVESAAADLLGMRIDAVTEHEAILDGEGKARIDLPHGNISSLTMWADFNRAFGDEAAVPETSYVLDPDRGIVRRVDGGIWIPGRGVIKAVYDGGYDSTNLKARIRRAIFTQAIYNFRRRKDVGLSSTRYPDGGVEKYSTDEWLPEAKQALLHCARLYL